MDKINYKNFYNRYANRYLRLFRQGDMFFHDKIQKPQLAKYLNERTFKKVLDIGCGFGFYSEYLANFSGSVIGVDISDEMIALAKQQSIKLNVEYVCEDILLYEPDEKFNFIFAGFMPSYFVELKEVFNKLFNITAVDGEIVITMLHPIRMSAIQRTDKGYYVKDYLKKGFYESDFLSENNPLLLYKHQYCQVFKAAKSAGFDILDIDEPVINAKDNKHMFYKYNPSIISYHLKKA